MLMFIVLNVRLMDCLGTALATSAEVGARASVRLVLALVELARADEASVALRTALRKDPSVCACLPKQ